MKLKNTLIYFTIFSMVITTFFTNIFAETATQSDTQTETTTAANWINHAEDGNELDIKAEACILVDAKTGDVIYEKNADDKKYPASITKIMTTYLACEYGHFSDNITFSNVITQIGYGSSNMGGRVGETMNFLDALYGVMLKSANETCMAVAETVSGSVDTFVAKMNETAAQAGCTGTHFANPHGFHDPNHYTTARDMSKIARLAITNETFKTIWGTEDYVIEATNMSATRHMYNSNQLINPSSEYYYPYCKGGKTGFHDDAGNTLVTYSVKDGTELICVVLKDNGKQLAYEDSKKLFEYGFAQFEDKTIFTADSFTSEIPVSQNYSGHTFDLGKVGVKAENDLTTKFPKFGDMSQITWQAENMTEALEAPVESGMEVGTIGVYYKGEKIGDVKAVTASSVEERSTEDMDREIRMEKFKSIAVSSAKYVAAGVLLVLIIFLIAKLIGGMSKKRKNKKLYEGKKRKKKTKFKIEF